MIHDDIALSLFDASSRLGVSPSAIKKRVAQLNLPVQRGARGKLIFDRHAYSLLLQADELLKQGHGFDECRRRLGLEAPARQPLLVFGHLRREASEEVLEAELVEEAYVEPAVEAAAPTPVTFAPAPGANPTGPGPAEVASPEPGGLEMGALEAPAREAAAAEPVAADEEPRVRKLPPPVFIQLGKKKSSSIIPPDLLARLDGALKLLEEKERHNQMLQAKLLVAYDEMTKLSATAAAFQERSLNLSHEVQKLQNEIKMLEAPGRGRPWWKFWG